MIPMPWSKSITVMFDAKEAENKLNEKLDEIDSLYMNDDLDFYGKLNLRLLSLDVKDSILELQIRQLKESIQKMEDSK